MKTPYDIIIKFVVSETSMMDAEQKKYTLAALLCLGSKDAWTFTQPYFGRFKMSSVNILS